MRIALLISGFTRSLSHNYPVIYNTLNDYGTVDVYIHFTKDEATIDKYSNQSTVSELVDLINPVAYLVEKDPEFDISDVQLHNTLCMWYKVYVVNELKRHREQISGFKYDLVIRWRPDVTLIKNNSKNSWLSDIFLNFSVWEKTKIFLPNNFENAYLENISDKDLICNDQIAIASSENMDYYANLYWKIQTYLNHGIKPHSSQLLYHHLTQRESLDICKFHLEYKLTLSLCNVVGIMGDSGSGKSTLAKILGPLFSLKSLTLECDRYHRWERQNINWQTHTHLNPKSNHLDKMEDDLFQLKAGNDIYQVDYDHQTGNFTEAQKIKSENNIILCGLHTFYHGKMLNLKIFTNPQKELKYYWKLQRDVLERGYQPEKVLENIQKRMDDYLQYIDPWKNDSDIIINFRFFDDIRINRLEDYLDLLKTSCQLKIYLRIYFRKNIDLFPLNKYFQEINYQFQIGYDIDLNYLDFFEEEFSAIQIQQYLKNLSIEINETELQSGYNGIIQLVCLYLFYQQSNDVSGTLECAQKQNY